VSFNRFALVAAQSLLPVGASLDIFELDGIPVYNQDLDKQPGASARRTPSSSPPPSTTTRCPGR